MNKDNRSVNERLDAIEEKLTAKPKKEIFFNDTLLEETGLTAKEYFQNGKATYKRRFSKFPFIVCIVMIAALSLFLIATLCINALVLNQSTNVLTIMMIVIPLIHAACILIYLLASEKIKPLTNKKHALVKLDITDDNYCYLTIKKDYTSIIINSIFFAGELTLSIMMFFFKTTFPTHTLYTFVSTIIGLSVLVFVEIIYVNNYSFRGETVFTYDKGDSKAVYTNRWHYVKKS